MLYVPIGRKLAVVARLELKELVTVPLTLLPKIYEAVLAVVINTEALTHDAEVVDVGTKFIELAVADVVATDELNDELAQELETSWNNSYDEVYA